MNSQRTDTDLRKSRRMVWFCSFNHQKREEFRWRNYQSIRRKSTITQPPLIITPPLIIIIIKLSIITRWGSTRTQSNMQLRLTNIVN